ncbi:MAG TPA: Sec-independent protein translocase protein TatB [Burkholderiales bacterium]
MFDVGFSELMVIAVVALIVIGPERLPKVARTLGHLVGRLQRYVNDVKADINREIELDELRKFKTTFEDAAREMEHTVHNEAAKAESEMNAIAQSVDAAATGGLTHPGTASGELQAPKTEVDPAARPVEEAAKAPKLPEAPGAEQPQTAQKSPA